MRGGALKIVAGLVALGAVVPAHASAIAPSDVYEVRSIETARFGVPQPETLAARAGRLVVGQAGRAVRLTPAERSLGRARSGGRARTTARFGGSVYTLRGRRLVVRQAGSTYHQIVSLRRLSLADPSAIAFAPTGDATDHPAARHLYVADPGTGRVVEVGFEYLSARASLTEVRARYVRTFATSAFDPASPDPSGVVHVSASDRFLIADSEVDEMAVYAGANLFTTPRGSLTGTGLGTTRALTKEPAGLAYNPVDATLYISDDDADRIIVDRPGADGRHGTSDDVWSRFGTAVFGSRDPEGIEYDPADGRLYVCDGIGLEMYVIDPVNGVFGDSGDVVTHFDVAVHGMRDCEGLGLDARRGTLLALDPTRRKIFELTKDGALSQIVDLNAIQIPNRNLASVAVAPTSSTDDSPTALSYYVADRGVDNGVDPNENDGRLHELEVPGAAPPPDAPPTVSVAQPVAGARVSGTVTVVANAADDNGVVSVRFEADGVAIGTDANGADGWSVLWDTTTTANGTHSVTAVAVDTVGNTAGAPPVPVTVENIAAGSSLVRAVAAGTDDASELENGTVNRTSGDLELGSDLGVPTTTGMRFAGIDVPRDAAITRAWVQFNADERNTSPATLTVRAQASDTAASYTSTAFNVSSRPRTTAAASWSVPIWNVFGEAGAAQQTPDLSAVVQDVINRPGWVSGNALAIIITGTGRRTAESFEGGKPPVLHVEFSGP